MTGSGLCNRTEQNRTEQNRTEQNRTEQNRTEQNRTANGVSVVVPVYNREKYLEECINSIKAQETDFPVEIILADDGSTDDSRIIAAQCGSSILNPSDLEEQENRSGIMFLNKPEESEIQGAAPTRNRAIAIAQYKYIAFLDSDDIYLPGHLQRLYDALETRPDAAFAFDEEMSGNDDMSKKWTLPHPVLKDNTKLNEIMLGFGFFPPVNAIMICRSVFDTVGVFVDELAGGEDIDMWLRILEKYPFVFATGYGCVVREHSERSTQNVRRNYEDHQKVLDRAVARYPYPAWLVRKRKAVINFKLGKCDIAERKYISGLFRLIFAGLLDPVRAMKTLLRRIANERIQ